MLNAAPLNNCRQKEVVYEGQIQLQDEDENVTNESYTKAYKGLQRAKYKKENIPGDITVNRE